MPDKYLVLSDMHFGTRESSVNNPDYLNPLIDHIASNAPWKEIVLTGDLIDLNLATFTLSIEGDEGLTGFRKFLSLLHENKGHISDNWVYTPGNHDYKLWDMLSAKYSCMDVLAAGNPMKTVPTPLMKAQWDGAESFFSGIFSEFGWQGRVKVSYPNHTIRFGGGNQFMLLTHGHYLDKSQTRFVDIEEHFKGLTGDELIKARRSFFIWAAQYQTLANAVSYTHGTRTFIGSIFGPEGLTEKIEQLKEWILSKLYSVTGRRGEVISSETLEKIAVYLQYFCDYRTEDFPAWFVFGHTHRQDFREGKGLKVFNAGSCYPEDGKMITFIQIETDEKGLPLLELRHINKTGKVITSFQGG